MEKHNGNEIQEAFGPWKWGRPSRPIAYKRSCSLMVPEGKGSGPGASPGSGRKSPWFLSLLALAQRDLEH